MPSERLWFIVSKTNGVYSLGGTCTRRRAIAEHVNALDEECHRQGNRGWGGLTPAHKRAWKERRARGDRAVKCTVTWDKGDD